MAVEDHSISPPSDRQLRRLSFSAQMLTPVERRVKQPFDRLRLCLELHRGDTSGNAAAIVGVDGEPVVRADDQAVDGL